MIYVLGAVGAWLATEAEEWQIRLVSAVCWPIIVVALCIMYSKES